MDKYIVALCKQNPKMKLECKNPECGFTVEVKTEDVFRCKEYKFVCPQCNKETHYETTAFVDDFKKQLKALGITLK